MRNVKALEMLNEGRIGELKKELQDEIYQETLKTKPDAKKRYTAMKKYFKYYKPVRESLQKPCIVEFEDKFYTSFTNSWSLALTTEDTGEIELFDKEKGNYPDVTRLVHFDGDVGKIDFGKVIAEAKSKGYKLVKGEVDFHYKYLMLYNGSYYKIGLLDATFGIIDDGQPVLVYKAKGRNKPMTIRNDIGICLVMPLRYDGDPEKDGKIVIEVN
jgi:hypothetical protein